MALPTLNLSEKQIEQLADILSDVALLVTASTIIPSILLEFHAFQLIIGAFISMVLWLYSIKIN